MKKKFWDIITGYSSSEKNKFDIILRSTSWGEKMFDISPDNDKIFDIGTVNANSILFLL